MTRLMPSVFGVGYRLSNHCWEPKEVFMLNVFRKNYLSLVFSIGLLVTVALLVTGCDQDSEQSSVCHKVNGPIKHRVNGPIKVSYKFKTSDTSATTTSEKDVSEILMFEQYIIIKEKSGFSRFMPISRIVHLSWK